MPAVPMAGNILHADAIQPYGVDPLFLQARAIAGSSDPATIAAVYAQLKGAAGTNGSGSPTNSLAAESLVLPNSSLSSVMGQPDGGGVGNTTADNYGGAYGGPAPGLAGLASAAYNGLGVDPGYAAASIAGMMMGPAGLGISALGQGLNALGVEPSQDPHGTLGTDPGLVSNAAQAAYAASMVDPPGPPGADPSTDVSKGVDQGLGPDGEAASSGAEKGDASPGSDVGGANGAEMSDSVGENAGAGDTGSDSGDNGDGGNSGGDSSGDGGNSGGGDSGADGGSYATGGTVRKQFSLGGHVQQKDLQGPNPPGPDTGYAPSLQDGEFVVRKDMAARYAPILRQINAGTYQASGHYAQGGEVSDNASRYADAGQPYGIDPLFLRAMAIVESGENDGAVSGAGAQGRMQFMPPTARGIGVTNAFDPNQSVPGAAKHMNDLLDQAGGDPVTALKLYHAGPDRRGWGPLTEAYPVKVAAVYAKLRAQAGADGAGGTSVPGNNAVAEVSRNRSGTPGNGGVQSVGDAAPAVASGDNSQSANVPTQASSARASMLRDLGLGQDGTPVAESKPAPAQAAGTDQPAQPTRADMLRDLGIDEAAQPAAQPNGQPQGNNTSQWRRVAPWQAPDGSMTTIAPEDYQSFISGGTPARPAQNPDLQRQDMIGTIARGVHSASQFVNGSADAVTHGMTAGLDRVIKPAIDAGIGAITGGPSFSQGYDQSQAAMDADRHAFEAQYPATSLGSEIVGGVTSPLGAAFNPLFASSRAAGIAGKVANYGRNVGAGAAMGGSFGYGMGEGGVENRLQSAGEGAALGAGFSALTPPIAAVVSAPFRAASRMIRPLTPSGPSLIAGRALNETAGGNALAFEPSPIAGLNLNTAQATNDPNIAAMTRQRGNVNQGAMRATQQEQNQALIDTLTGRNPLEPALSTGASASDASSGFTNALRAGRDAAGKEETRLWTVPELAAQPVTHSVVQNSVNQAAANLDPGLQAAMTGQLSGLIGKLNAMPQGTIRDLNTIRSGFERIARTSSDGSERAIARELSNAFMQGLDKVPEIAGRPAQAVAEGWQPSANGAMQYMPAHTVPVVAPDPALVSAYQAARDYTRQMRTMFGTQDVNGALNRNAAGNYTRDASSGADPFFQFNRGAGEGAQNISQIADFLNGIKGEHAQLAGQARDALTQNARDFIIARALDRAQGPTLDTAGQQIIRPNQLFDWINTNKPWIERSGLFSTPQIDLLGRLQKASEMVARTNNNSGVVGSPTYSYLAGDKFIDGLLGPITSRVSGMVLGGTLSHLGGGNGVIGAMVGSEAGNIMRNLYSAPRDAAISLIDAALRDPKIAHDLMRKAAPMSSGKFSPETISALRRFGILAPPALLRQPASPEQNAAQPHPE